LKKELKRQSVHLLLGSIILLLGLIFFKETMLLVLGISLIVSFIFSFYLLNKKTCIPVINFFLESCERKHENICL
jgi:hypothetical protein